MTTLQHWGGHHKVGGREEVQKLLGEGLFRKSETKQGKEELGSNQSGCTSQTAGRPYVPFGTVIHDDNDAVFIELNKGF